VRLQLIPAVNLSLEVYDRHHVRDLTLNRNEEEVGVLLAQGFFDILDKDRRRVFIASESFSVGVQCLR